MLRNNSKIIILLFAMLTVNQLFSADNCLFSEKDVKQKMLTQLFNVLDPQKMSAEYRKAISTGDTRTLVKETAKYFRNREKISLCTTGLTHYGDAATADRAVNGDVTVVDIPWQFADGNIDWKFNPTYHKTPVNHEWLWQLNRMYFWNDMSAAYDKTADEKYAAAFNRQLGSWLSIAGYPPEKDWNAPGSIWRTIETGLRLMTSWNTAFEIFRKSPAFTDENICLMLSSMYCHAVHLQQHHKIKRNWLLMEMSGLYNFAVNFPEFKASKNMRQYASVKFCDAILEQILPDGFHSELSPDYHGVMIACAMSFIHIAKSRNAFSDLPDNFIKKIEQTFNVILDTATPGLFSPRTNDCGTIKIKSKMQTASELFPNRKDFLWAATEREQGAAPSAIPTASRFLPWAGFAVMRSNWSKDALYCLFDTGPLGEGHMHQDKLNINIYKGDEELIYDDGGGHYEQSELRQYALSAAAHNTILVDGLGQKRKEPLKVTEPVNVHWITNNDFDYAKSAYDDEFGNLISPNTCKPAIHTREVRFYKPDFFCVHDILSSRDGKTHSYEMRLHFETTEMKKVGSISGAWISDFKRKYDILVIPLFPEEVSTTHLSGKKQPAMAGWFVERKKVCPGSTLAMTVSEKKDCRFATLLVPVEKGKSLPEISQTGKNTFTVKWKNKTHLIDLENLDK